MNISDQVHTACHLSKIGASGTLLHVPGSLKAFSASVVPLSPGSGRWIWVLVMDKKS